MRDKIIAAFKAKYSSVTLSQKRLDALADKLSPKITEENQIDAKLEELNEIFPFADIQKEDDRMRTLEAQVKQKEKPKEKEEPKEETAPPKQDEDLATLVRSLAEEVKGLKAEKQQATIKQQVSDKLKDVPAVFWSKRPLPTKDEELEAFVTDVQNDFNSFTQETVDKGGSQYSKPKGGNVKADKTASKEEVDAILDKIKI